MRWATHVHVAVHHTLHHSSEEAYSGVLVQTASVMPGCIYPMNRPPPGSASNSLQAVADAVLDTLAAAMPNLKKLSIDGGFGQPVIRAFGLLCPQLTSLQVEALSVPATALQHVSKHLPRLTHLTLRACFPGWEGFKDRDHHSLATYLSAAMVHLRPCAVLTTLETDWDVHSQEACGKECWDLAPHSLQEFSCNVPFQNPRTFLRFGSRLRRITMRNDLCGDLQQFLNHHPFLEELTVLGFHTVDLLDAGRDYKADRQHVTPDYYLPLKERFAAGFKLSCSTVLLAGPSGEVREFLGWLPPLPSVKDVGILLKGNSRVECLQQLAGVFPSLSYIYVGGERPEGWNPWPVADAEVFAPLSACTSLTRICLLVHVAFTTQGLFQMCQGLPALNDLKFVDWEDVDSKLLGRAVSLVDRKIDIQVCHDLYGDD